jgi:tRNA(Ile)-lysidine synthase TilS/MesJ
MKICRRCILPENFPHVTIGADGICNFCREYKGRADLERLKARYRRKMDALISRTRDRGEYDVLVSYSGGKDSTYALDLLKRRYKLKMLAISIDNGFVPPRTYINIRNVVENLNVDHIFFKPRFDILRKVFRVSMRKCLYPEKTLERASTVCTSCMGFIKYVAIKTAIEKEIPLIAFGWSPGQAPVTSSVLEIAPAMLKRMESALRGPLFKICGYTIDPYFLNERHYLKPEKFPVFIHPLALIDYNEKSILGRIKALGWRRPYGVELNATNCYLNPLADKAHIDIYKFHPYLLEIANFVREGYMTRQEGLKHIPFKKNERIVRLAKSKLGL